jgi:DNA primase large subunit
MREQIQKMTRQHRFAVQAKVSKDNNIASTIKLEDRAEFKENDNISHFICRLAYCRNEELRKWFITQETRLFSLRLGEFHPAIIKQLLESKLGIAYEEVKATDQVWQ